MLICNLLEYSDNYSVQSGNLWNYYRDEMNNDASKNNANNDRIINNKTKTCGSFNYKTKTIGSLVVDNKTIDTKVFVKLICL